MSVKAYEIIYQSITRIWYDLPECKYNIILSIRMELQFDIIYYHLECRGSFLQNVNV